MSDEQRPSDGGNGAADIPAGTPLPRNGDPGRADNEGVSRDRVQPPRSDRPHDVLAAEEFAFPAVRPAAPAEADTRSEPHDVLAAEEFAFPVTNPRAPADPRRRPHDVLAAEEFAFPAAAALDPTITPSGPARASRPALLATGVAGLVLLALGARRRRQHG